MVDDLLPSEVLGLALGEHQGELRLYDPVTSQWLQTPPERAEKRRHALKTLKHALKMLKHRAQQETDARQNVEAELAKVLAELEHLRR